ncbi:FAD-dependent oxidoreductase [Pseudactinotalea sp. Z1739]|uniref:FAD-dependent oxidoreductase n=1 Tax=Pseudactinotalea sp. Z1739 TaxID=3413028 RepID=UPI003C7CF0F2
MSDGPDLWRPDSRAWRHTTKQQLAAWRYGHAVKNRSFDLLVVGGGLSGVAAAVAASRRGTRCAIIEESHMLGGQASTSAVAAFDITFAYEVLLNGYGLWGEIVDRLRIVYDSLGLAMNTARYRDDSLAANPVIIDRVLGEMVKEAGVSVFRRSKVLDAGTARVGVSVDTDRGVFSGKYVVDATEDGALLPLLGADHRVGNLVFRDGDLGAGSADRVSIQDITQAVTVQYYPGGLPDDLRVPEPPRYMQFRREFLGTYPYDPSGARVSDRGFAGYRATPDLSGRVAYTGSQWEQVTRTSLNYLNDFPVQASYLLDKDRQLQDDRQATLKTLALLHFLQQEVGAPWSVATDEGFAAITRPRRFADLVQFENVLKHFPPRVYMRESRRGIGIDTLTAKSIFRHKNRTPARWYSDVVAVGTYPPDLHGGRAEEDLEDDLDETFLDKPTTWREGPFGIPSGCLIHAGIPSLLLAEKNISVSRIVAGATRLHPTVVGIGEAVGTLASISIRTDSHPTEVSSLQIQTSLLRNGAFPFHSAIKGLERTDSDFATVALAVIRELVPTFQADCAVGERVLGVERGVARTIGKDILNGAASWDK